jgi:hypothetical protein
VALALKAGKRVVGLRGFELDGMVQADSAGEAVAAALDGRP